MITLTVERTRELLRAAVAERGPDFVYPEEWKDCSPRFDGAITAAFWSCLYVQPDGTGPACIAGDVLYRAGVSLDVLRNHEFRSPREILANLKRLGILTTTDERIGRALGAAQSAQDRGLEWGTALDDAEYELDFIE